MVDPCWWLNIHGFKYSYTYPFFEFVSWLFGRVPTQQMGGARILLLPICKGVRLLLASLRFFWRVRPAFIRQKRTKPCASFMHLVASLLFALTKYALFCISRVSGNEPMPFI